MKYSKFALIGLMFANSALYAAMPAEGWYAGLMGGVSYSPGITGQIPSPLPLIQRLLLQLTNTGLTPLTPIPLTTPLLALTPVPLTPVLTPGFLRGSLTHGLGGDGGGQLGYRFCNFRFEGELLVNYAPFTQAKGGGFTVGRHRTPTTPVRMSGRTLLGAALFNVFYDFYDEENDPSFVPYVGLGIGYAHMQNTLTFTVPAIPLILPTSLHVNAKSNNNAPIGQIILGISYYSSDDLSIGLDYRFVTTNTFTNNNRRQTNTTTNFNTRVQANTLNLNFNYWFED